MEIVVLRLLPAGPLVILIAMLVFVSWSGPRSRRMAEALRDWLPQIIQQLQVFVSTDIVAGKRWSSEIGTRLKDTRFGVICVTPENQDASWLNFEAGACSKHMEDSHVCPYVLQGSPADYKGPMTQFQMVGSDREGTLQLVAGLNHAAPARLDGMRLEKQFERCWPELDGVLNAIRAEQAEQPRQERRDTDDMIREVLELVRTRSSAVPSAGPPVQLSPTSLTNKALLEALIGETVKASGMQVSGVKVRDNGAEGYLVKVYSPQGAKRGTIPLTALASAERVVEAVRIIIC